MEVPIGGPSMPGEPTTPVEPAISIVGEEAEAPVPETPAPEISVEEPEAPREGAPKKGLFSKGFMQTKLFKILAVVGVVIVIIMASMIYLMYGVTGVDRVRVIANDTPWNATKLGLKVFVITESLGTSSFGGDADIKIIYEDTDETTYTGKVSMSSDKGDITIPYDEFLTGPGAYTIKVTADGETGVTFYNCDRLITTASLQPDAVLYPDWYDIGTGWDFDSDGITDNAQEWNATTDPEPDHGIYGKVNFGTVAEILPGTTLDIELYNNNETDTEYELTGIDLFQYQIDNEGSPIYSFWIDYDYPAEYTFNAIVHNPTLVTSTYHEVPMDHTQYFNAVPLVDAGDDLRHANPPVAGSETVHFNVEYRDENKNSISTSSNENQADINWTFLEGSDLYYDWGTSASHDYDYPSDGHTKHWPVFIRIRDPDNPSLIASGLDEVTVAVHS